MSGANSHHHARYKQRRNTRTSNAMYRLWLSLKDATRFTMQGNEHAARMFLSFIVCCTCGGPVISLPRVPKHTPNAQNQPA